MHAPRMDVQKKEMRRFVFMLALCIFCSWAVLQLRWVTAQSISSLGVWFQWAIVFMAVMIVIEMLAGLRLRRGLSGVKRIQRLARFHYLDNIPRAAYTATAAALLTAFCGCVLGTGAASPGAWEVLTVLGTYSAVTAGVFSIWSAGLLMRMFKRHHRSMSA